jgi:hypothetical protein
MAHILRQIQHLVRFAHWAYMNDDGAEFRSAAWDLQGDVQYRKLEIVTPCLGHRLAELTPNTHVHLGIRHGETLVLAFRGTDFPFTIENLVRYQAWWGFWGNIWTDFAFRMDQVPWLPAKPSPVLVHGGFLAAFDNLLVGDRLRQTILHLTEGIEPLSIEVCGHSLGGALATLCASWCRLQWPEADITCVTLGSPRVGNAAFCQHFDECMIRCYRLEVDADPVPTIPDRFVQALPGKLPASNPGWTDDDMRYRHVGLPIILHQAGAGTPYNSADLGVERPDIQAEDGSPDIPWMLKMVYQCGGWMWYWTLRGMKMAPAIWTYHDPGGYETVVQRILENKTSQRPPPIIPGAFLPRSPNLTGCLGFLEAVEDTA